jgi:hypothetical protein
VTYRGLREQAIAKSHVIRSRRRVRKRQTGDTLLVIGDITPDMSFPLSREGAGVVRSEGRKGPNAGALPMQRLVRRPRGDAYVDWFPICPPAYQCERLVGHVICVSMNPGLRAVWRCDGARRYSFGRESGDVTHFDCAWSGLIHAGPQTGAQLPFG